MTQRQPAPGVAARPAWQSDEVPGLRIDTDVVMTTRDGVVLRADVYRPDDDLPHPALLHRTPYDKANPTLVSVLIADPVALARAGYAVVVQDVRGRFASDGVLDFGEQEHDDGYDAVEWTAEQPWCNGRVGIYGSSYHAIAAYAALAAAPPHLEAVFVMTGAADLATTVRPGGLFELGFLAYYSLGQTVEQIRRSARPPAEKQALVGRVMNGLVRMPETVAATPVADVDVLADGSLAPWWGQWMGDESGSYVTRSLARPEHDVPLPDIPLMTVVGFRDFMQQSMMTVFARRPASVSHRLVAGPWAHNGAYTGHVGARALLGRAGGGVASWQPVILGWFDRWLMDAPDRVVVPAARAFLDGPPVSWFESGPDRWARSDSWPPPGVTPVTWFLGAGGRLGADSGEGSTAYRHDPADPVPTCGGVMTAPMLGPDGIQDQRARQARADVAVWTSDVLNEAVTTAGAPSVTVFVSSTAEDTDLVVVLSDLEPGGFVVNVAEGALRTRGRGGATDAWLVPGEITEVTVPLHHTGHTFRVGHRIRVDLAGSSFPRFSRNLGTRTVPELGRLEDGVASDQLIHHGADHPSRLVLPVLPVLPRPT